MCTDNLILYIIVVFVCHCWVYIQFHIVMEPTKLLWLQIGDNVNELSIVVSNSYLYQCLHQFPWQLELNVDITKQVLNITLSVIQHFQRVTSLTALQNIHSMMNIYSILTYSWHSQLCFHLIFFVCNKTSFSENVQATL